MMWHGQLNGQKGHLLFYAAVFFSFFALYAATAQRGVSWQDSGYFQYRMLAGDYRGAFGIALAHPLYIALARGFLVLFPKAACFYAINLFSGLGLSLALVLLAHNVMRLTRSVRAAVIAVSVLGFAHMAWWLGTIAEVYTWSLAFLMAEILCLIRYAESRDSRWLVVLFGVNGTHWSIHNAALLGLPVYAYLLAAEIGRLKGRCWGTLCGCAVFWLIGGGMIIWQATGLLLETGAPVRVLNSVLFGDGYERQVLGTGGFAFKLWAANAVLAGVSFMNPCWLFAGRGFFVREGNGQRGVLNWLRVLTVLHGLFWIRYFVPDQVTFILPTLGLLAVWVGLGSGVGGGLRKGSWKPVSYLRRDGWLVAGVACALMGPLLLCEAVQRTGQAVSRSRTLPFRDETSYWVLPWKQHETSAAHFAADVGKQLHAGDVLLADSTAAGPLLAAKVAGVLTEDWRLITPWSGVSDSELLNVIRDTSTRFYVVSPVKGYVPQAVLEAGCSFSREGAVYRGQLGQR